RRVSGFGQLVLKTRAPTRGANTPGCPESWRFQRKPARLQSFLILPLTGRGVYALPFGEDALVVVLNQRVRTVFFAVAIRGPNPRQRNSAELEALELGTTGSQVAGAVFARAEVF